MAKTRSVAPPAKRAKIADMSAMESLPLLPGENRADHERLRAAVIAMMKPADFMEKDLDQRHHLLGMGNHSLSARQGECYSAAYG